MTELDTSLFIRDTVRPLVKRFENLRFSGYIQSQYQVISKDGAKTYGGGDFSDHSRSRFMLRRARMKMDYLALTDDKLPRALFSFQVDATERSVRVRDMFIRIFETKKNNFSLTTGVFARPFGFEVNLSSSYRETPERGRMSQILLPSERDLGAMISYEPQRKNAHNHFIKADVGVFNGPGLSATTDFDSKRDFIGRVILKPFRKKKIEMSGSVSVLYGGWEQISKFVYKVDMSPSGNKSFLVDSAASNIGKTAPRHYYGADFQLKWLHGWGITEWRAEYWTGKQSGTALTTANPGTLPIVPTFIRNFNGAFFYFLQNIVNSKNQLLVKYDWYDPNTRIAGNEIGKAGTNFTDSDIKFSTLGVGFARDITNTVKAVLYYEIVKNETTLLTGYTTDLKDNLFTCRLQFRF
ncbi:MAG: porin [Chitinophagaceae bacterium]